MNKPVLEINDLSVRLSNLAILEEINLTVGKDEFIAIIGPNGAGKSTFLKVLLGIIPVSSGSVRLFGNSVQNISPEWIGYVPQIKTMDRNFPAMSIELVMTGLNQRWPWRFKSKKSASAIEALERVGAAHLAYRPLNELSGGELQRVFLARSLARQPKLIMLDEPATGIDVTGEADLYRVLDNYQKETKCTILMITHDWEAVKHHVSHVMILNRRLVGYGPPEKALTDECLRRAFGHIGHEHAFNQRFKDNV
ncbi:MAG: metal ABC transporter ATP-binding protein [Calditrichaceae bacterium]